MNSALLQAVDEIWNAKRLSEGSLAEGRLTEGRVTEGCPAAIAAPPRRFPLVRLRQLEPDLDGQYMVDGLLPRATLVVVWGPPKCGKSFWTLDLVAHIATG